MISTENIQMNRPVNEDIDDVLSRLDELYLLRKNRYLFLIDKRIDVTTGGEESLICFTRDSGMLIRF